MSRICIIILIIVFSGSVTLAQPAYSPAVRTERTMKWMHDSLNVTTTQSTKLHDIELNYQSSMDKAKSAHDKKSQKQLMQKKDADVKTVLHNDQRYKKYYRREQIIRKQEQVVYKGHQPE